MIGMDGMMGNQHRERRPRSMAFAFPIPIHPHAHPPRQRSPIPVLDRRHHLPSACCHRQSPLPPHVAAWRFASRGI